MVTGEFVLVKQNDSPSDKEINEILEKVIASVKKLYDTKKPDWEKRPLIITWKNIQLEIFHPLDVYYFFSCIFHFD